MTNLLFAFFLFFFSSHLFAQEKIPYFIDFGTDEFETHFHDVEFLPEWGNSFPFNGASEMSTFFAYLKEKYNIRTVVETGTFKGNTTACFATIFDTVHTVEISIDFYNESQTYLKHFSNVHSHFGDSPSVLRQLLPELSSQPTIFYLDAHWLNIWPLSDELREISKTHKDNCIIVIDDFKVPGRSDIPYDTHRIGNRFVEYSLEYIQLYLSKIFSEYTVHYLIPKVAQARGKIVVMPKKWSCE